MIETKDLPPAPDHAPIRRALISVSDKAGVADFAARLHDHGVEILSTGGTAHTLREAGLPVTDAAEATGSPEILGGRVKTLHPAVHGGILARRTDEEDLAELQAHEIRPIDLVAVNLYPFREAVSQENADDALAAENIDIGGPTLLRAAAKNFAFVTAVVDPADYDRVAGELDDTGGASTLSTRRALARKAFAHTADYDAAITRYFTETTTTGEDDAADTLPETLSITLPRAKTLRYGENPHQPAALYGRPEAAYSKLHGKALSFNNLLDLSAGLSLIGEFAEAPPTLAILKHTNPCGVGRADSLEAAYRKALATDRQSPFGGIVVMNRALDRATAEAIDQVFTEIIIAPSYEEGVLDFLMQKKNRRLVEASPQRSGLEGDSSDAMDVRTVAGGLLLQRPDPALPNAEALRNRCEVATERSPTDAEWADLDFAWRVCKHVKSNAIVYAGGGATLGIGAGQMSRIDSSELAVMKSVKSDLDLTGCVVASDAFFPFADGLNAAAEAGATAAIQPGGSIRDEEVVDAANARDMAMVFTGHRHFRH